MPSLSELQRGFAAAILLDDRAAAARLGIAGGRLDAASRIAIYRNNVLGNYRKALGATFPVVRALVGPPRFGAMVAAFVRAHPCTRGDVNRYGGELPRFLETHAPLRALPWLPDVARLEWAIDQAAIARDAEALDLAALAAVPPSELGRLRLRLHPSARLLRSAYPVLGLWQAHQRGEAHERVDVGEGGEALLAVRGAGGVTVHRLAAGVHAFLSELGDDRDLDDAVERALVADPTFDLGEALRAYVGLGTIVGFRTPASI
jgi:hypothetical protein